MHLLYSPEEKDIEKKGEVVKIPHNMVKKILKTRGCLLLTACAVLFITGCSGKKSVQFGYQQQEPPGVEEEPSEHKSTQEPLEQTQVEIKQKEPAGTEVAADNTNMENTEELTISVPEQNSKIEVVLPESDNASPAIDAGEAKQEAENILEIINRLEEMYEKDDFEGWKSMLTPDYRKKYSNPENLRKDGWDAADLHSFFNLLVDTRRKGQIKTLKISRVVFTNQNKAYVYVFFEDREFPEPQHTFIRINGTWLKGLREEEG